MMQSTDCDPEVRHERGPCADLKRLFPDAYRADPVLVAAARSMN
jgi:hypothetical protein